jgi:hypothetical protein
MDCDRCESHTQPMPSSLGVEQRIRELCARALMVSDSECIELLGELRNVIREQSEALRKLASKKLGNEMDTAPAKDSRETKWMKQRKTRIAS